MVLFMKNELLLLPDKIDSEWDQIANLWQQSGGSVKRIGKFWVKPDTHGKKVSLYGFDSFCLVLAQILELELVLVQDEWIGDLSFDVLKRKVSIQSIETVEQLKFPLFVKSVVPKLFKAAVFESLSDLQTTTSDLPKSEQLICSDIIMIEKEVRAFILNKEIKAIAFHEGQGDLNMAQMFIHNFLETAVVPLPTTFVLDIGYNSSDGWFVIEFNSTWGAGLNNCSPQGVISCIRAATL
jgi:hypothetical protein